ncbi:hypothetical protein KC19_5G160600 [Ceratodon purpureus]|uniref:Uncharacterized protein n=1 Tax=Ceratodon purpureus TaxID=3225 RepID=A0A8T0I220_CERPU|nr:hypothetical protein KC19_5G160600 [Ceratodon purpureus]
MQFLVLLLWLLLSTRIFDLQAMKENKYMRRFLGGYLTRNKITEQMKCTLNLRHGLLTTLDH